ncbi:hypothetical protein BvCmsB39A_02334 [Escherichia coli]|nr:hypothetical protein BvCmsB39A_02334 [Escherichia coli]
MIIILITKSEVKICYWKSIVHYTAGFSVMSIYSVSASCLSIYIVVARFSLTIVINFIYGGSIQTTRQQTPRYLSEFPEQKF